MRQFNITPPPFEELSEAIQSKIDNLNKPKGSLGRLESLAMQICLAQQTLSPTLRNPHHLLFGSDHGIEREGVSVSPREITWQQMINFTRGGGGVNMFCRQHGFTLRIVDVGVDYDLSAYPEIIDRKIARGTENFLYGPAMTEEQFDKAIAAGVEQVDACADAGCAVVCIGEMGIANTSPSSIWMSLFGGIPLDECIGAGAGLDSPGIQHKREVLGEAVKRYLSNSEECRGRNSSKSEECRVKRYDYSQEQKTSFEGNHTSTLCTQTSDLEGNHTSTLCTQTSDLEGNHTSTLCTQTSDLEGNHTSSLITLNSDPIKYFGGFEMVAAIGAMLRAAERHIIILVDGFIMTACALAASRLYPDVTHYMIFGHCGDESGHRRMLELMNAEPLLHLGLRLGEGTGALCSFPIVDSAVRMMNEMNNFQDANITKYF